MSNGNEFVIVREYEAPKKLVYEMWTSPEHLNHWWGPAGMKVEVVRMEFKPGGTFLYSIVLPDGGMVYGKFVYREIVPYEKIVFVDSFCDANGNPQRHPIDPGWPIEILNTIMISEQNGKTLLTLKGISLNASEAEVKTFVKGFGSLKQGWSGTLAQLENYLSSVKIPAKS